MLFWHFESARLIFVKKWVWPNINEGAPSFTFRRLIAVPVNYVIHIATVTAAACQAISEFRYIDGLINSYEELPENSNM